MRRHDEPGCIEYFLALCLLGCLLFTVAGLVGCGPAPATTGTCGFGGGPCGCVPTYPPCSMPCAGCCPGGCKPPPMPSPTREAQ